MAAALHADVLLLQKPWATPWAGLDEPCGGESLQQDHLPAWRDHLIMAVRQHIAEQPDFWRGPPLLWVGLSEGAELIPSLVPHLPPMSAVVLVSSSGLNPQRVGAAQAHRQGHTKVWQNLSAQVHDARWPNDHVTQGRSLLHWRTLFAWSVEDGWVHVRTPLLRVWGSNDQHIPPAIYEEGASVLKNAHVPWCDWVLPNADHHLQSPERDGVQWLWHQIERWGRHHGHGVQLCELPLVPLSAHDRAHD
jgi:hypothetical protein